MATPIINDLTDMDGNPVNGTGEKIRDWLLEKLGGLNDNETNKDETE